MVSIDKEKHSHQKIIITLFQSICPNHFALHASKQSVHSNDVEALATVLKKSAKEPKNKLS